MAKLIIDDIEKSCVPRFPEICCPEGNCAPPPTIAELCEQARQQRKCCKEMQPPPKDPFLPKNCPGVTSNVDEADQTRGPQKGALPAESNPDVADRTKGPQKGG